MFRYSATFERMCDLHFAKEKKNDQLMPMRIELEDMRQKMMVAKSLDEAYAIRKDRRKLKREFHAHLPALEAIEKELSALSRSTPGNYLIEGGSGQFGRIPEPLLNYRGWAQKLKMKWK